MHTALWTLSAISLVGAAVVLMRPKNVTAKEASFESAPVGQSA
jgi:hypothetical protein